MGIAGASRRLPQGGELFLLSPSDPAKSFRVWGFIGFRGLEFRV